MSDIGHWIYLLSISLDVLANGTNRQRSYKENNIEKLILKLAINSVTWKFFGLNCRALDFLTVPLHATNVLWDQSPQMIRHTLHCRLKDLSCSLFRSARKRVLGFQRGRYLCSYRSRLLRVGLIVFGFIGCSVNPMLKRIHFRTSSLVT